MKKIISIMALLTILAVSVFAFSGCGKKENEDKNPLMGAWEYEGGAYTYHFNEDKTGYYEFSGSKLEFTYEYNASTIEILYNGNTSATSTEYRIQGRALIIKDAFGKDLKYNKK